jgi:hypothetical protein
MKPIFTIMFLSFIFTNVSAQVQFGIKAGYSIANVSYSNTENFSQRPISAFNGGFIASVPLSGAFSLQPELMYSEQGTDVIINTSYTVEYFKNRYNYLNIPVLGKYQHESGLFAETGPQLGILLNAKSSDQNVSADQTKYTESLDFGWAFGLGYKISKLNVGFDARYNLGLTNINKPPANQVAKNSVFQFDIYYYFKSL